MAYLGCDLLNFPIEESIPMMEYVGVEVKGDVAILSLQRVEALNALNPQLIVEVVKILNWISNHSAATSQLGNRGFRAIILRAEGRHFCAGADIEWMRASGAKSLEENRTDAARLDKLFHTLWSHPCFTIGWVQGVALGGGAGLVASLDHVIATPNSKIALSEGKLGILPAVIGPYVLRRLGPAQTRRLTMLASRIKSDEALRIGLIDQIATMDDFWLETESIVDELRTTGPVAVARAKTLVESLENWTGTVDEMRTWTLDLTSEMRGSAEGQEGLSAFLEKRTPNWDHNAK